MKDRIIEILTNSSKSISASDIMNLINSNYEAEDLKLLLYDLNELYKDGIVYQNKEGNYLLFENSHLLKGYIEINTSGSGFLLQDGEDGENRKHFRRKIAYYSRHCQHRQNVF